jgi:site-specific recombinase XerD
MNLMKAIEEYVSLKRSLGAIYTTTERILRSFVRFVGDIPLEEMTPQQCQQFCYGSDTSSATAAGKHQLLKQLFLHLVARGYLATSPAEGPTRRAVSTFQPYIYSAAELKRLLDCALQLDRHFHFDGYTLRILLLLLYATGMRLGEALALRSCDVDLLQQILTIWRAKFFKARLVPFGASLTQALREYLQYRNSLPLPVGSQSTFFATRSGNRISQSGVEIAFRRICNEVEIRRPASESAQPRIHDLRATFAVHRIVAWYREGVDVQRRLPLLAAYLGHTSFSGTQRYVRMTPELLNEASQLFGNYASLGKETEDE